MHFKGHKFVESFVLIGCWAFGGYCWLSTENLCEASSNQNVSIKAEDVLWMTFTFSETALIESFGSFQPINS